MSGRKYRRRHARSERIVTRSPPNPPRSASPTPYSAEAILRKLLAEYQIPVAEAEPASEPGSWSENTDILLPHGDQRDQLGARRYRVRLHLYRTTSGLWGLELHIVEARAPKEFFTAHVFCANTDERRYWRSGSRRSRGYHGPSLGMGPSARLTAHTPDEAEQILRRLLRSYLNAAAEANP